MSLDLEILFMLFNFGLLQQILLAKRQFRKVICLVHKEIESPGRVKGYIELSQVSPYVFFISYRDFSFFDWTECTSIYPIVGTGRILLLKIITVMFKTSDRKPRRYTLNDTTDRLKVSNCNFSLPIVFSERGKIVGGEDLHYLNSTISFTLDKPF